MLRTCDRRTKQLLLCCRARVTFFKFAQPRVGSHISRWNFLHSHECHSCSEWGLQHSSLSSPFLCVCCNISMLWYLQVLEDSHRDDEGNEDSTSLLQINSEFPYLPWNCIFYFFLGPVESINWINPFIKSASGAIRHFWHKMFVFFKITNQCRKMTDVIRN